MRISDWSSDVCSSDLPVTPHHAGPRADRVAVAAGEARGADRLALLGQRQDRGEARRFGWGQPVGAVAKIAPCARLDAIGADAGLRDVQINLHDPPLAPDFLDQEGEPDLWNLADIARPAAALPQEDILRGLLADGRTAAEFLALGVAFDRKIGRAHV